MPRSSKNGAFVAWLSLPLLAWRGDAAHIERLNRGSAGLLRWSATDAPPSPADGEGHAPADAGVGNMVHDLCRAENMLQLRPDGVAYSNLGRMGPDFGAPEGILFGDVFPQRGGRIVDLLITAANTSSDYKPADQAQNGARGQFGVIGMQTNTTLDLIFRFLDRASGAVTEVPPLFLSVVEMDRSCSTAISRSIVLGGFKSFALTQDSLMQVEGTAGNLTTFSMSRSEGEEPPVPAHPMHLDAQMFHKAATFMFPTVSEIRMQLTATGGDGGTNFFFAGGTNAVCPAVALCESHVCPERFVQRAQASMLACAGEECTAADTQRCCQAVQPSPCGSSSMLELGEGSVVFSNLGGTGPDFHQPEALVIGNVFPRAEHTVDLMVRAKGEYKAHNKARTGLQGRYGIINLLSGSETEIEFTFVDRETQQPRPMGPFYITFFDLDQQKNAHGIKSVRMMRTSHHNTTSQSQVLVNAINGSTFFTGQETGHVHDFPASPFQWSSDRLKSSFTAHFEETSNFTVSLKVTEGWQGRDFMFAGASSLTCAERASCSTYTCPSGYNLKAGTAASTLCSGSPCVESDTTTCCETEVPAHCSSEKMMSLIQGSVVYSNLGGFGPDVGSPEGILYADVFPKSGKTIDLQVNSVELPPQQDGGNDQQAPQAAVLRAVAAEAQAHAYRPSAAYRNGLNGSMGNINLDSGSAAQLRFRFINRATGAPEILWPFYFSILGIAGAESASAAEQAAKTQSPTSFIDHSAFFFSRRSEVVADDEGASDDDDVGAFDDSHVLSLTPTQKKQAVTFFLSNLSEFNITLAASALGPERDIRFAGASNLVCPPRESCRSFSCPTGFTARSDSSSRSCAGTRCTDLDTATCCLQVVPPYCSTARLTMFQSHRLLHSNLAGAGPDFGEPRGMLFGDVLPSIGRTTDLLITAQGDYRPATRPEFASRVGDGIASIGMMAGTDVTLNFTFIDRETKEVVALPHFMMSVLDLDHVGLAKMGTSLKAMGHSGYKVTNSSAFIVDNGTSFSIADLDTVQATQDPTALFGMSAAHKSRSVAFEFEDGTESFQFAVKIPESEATDSGALLRFAGGAPAFCRSRATCEGFSCPTNTRLKSEPALRVCEGTSCSAEDTSTCCEADQPAVCGEHRALSLRSVITSNLGLYGPDFHSPQGILYGNVFPGGRNTIDLMVHLVEEDGNQSETGFAPPMSAASQRADALGCTGCGSINMRAGRRTQLQFKFVDRATQQPVILPPFVFSLLDADLQEGSATSSFSPQGFVQYKLATGSVMAFDEVGHRFVAAGNGLSLTSRRRGSWTDESTRSAGDNVGVSGPFLLSAGQLQRTASFLMAPTSQFDVQWTASSGMPVDGKGRTLMFTGRTSLSCPGLAPCSSLTCPVGFSHTEGADAITCRGSTCGVEDTATCCVPSIPADCKEEKSLTFGRGGVLYSNLGGFGPDLDAPEGVLYGEVLVMGGSPIDLLVTAEGDFASPHSNRTGNHGGFGSIMLGNGTTRLKLQLIDRTTLREPENIEPFVLSVVHLTSNDDSASVSVEGLFLSAGSQVHAEGQTSWSIADTSMKREFLTHPLLMTTQHQPRVASYLLNSHTFHAEVNVSGLSSYSFTFAGPTTRSCPQRASCSSFQCPKGFMRFGVAERMVCAGSICSDVDISNCCKPNVERRCKEKFGMTLNLDRFFNSNFGGAGPDTSAEESLLWGDVFPTGANDTTIDLEVTLRNSSTVSQHFPEKNGFRSVFGRFTLPGGSTADVQFRLLERVSGQPASEEKLGPFFFSFFAVGSTADGSASEGGGQVSITVDAATSMKTSRTTALTAKALTAFASVCGEEECPVPEEPMNLSIVQRDRAVTFSLPASASVFTVQVTTPEGVGPVSFYFGGRSTVFCPARPTCSRYRPAAGFMLRNRSEFFMCSGDRCSDADSHHCAVLHPN